MGDNAPSHELDQHRRDACFHHMAAGHRDDSAFAGGAHQGVHDPAEVARGEDVGERTHERAEGAIRGWRCGELLGAYLVRPVRDGNGADPREVRFGRYCVAAAVPGVYDFR